MVLPLLIGSAWLLVSVLLALTVGGAIRSEEERAVPVPVPAPLPGKVRVLEEVGARPAGR